MTSARKSDAERIAIVKYFQEMLEGFAMKKMGDEAPIKSILEKPSDFDHGP